MASNHTYPIRTYAVGQHLLLLRSRTKLTQAEFAARIGIHRRSVQKWESGETYPTAENLRTVIALLLTLGGLTPGEERTEATKLWQRVSEDAPQPLPFFDSVWFEQLLAARAGNGLSAQQRVNGVSEQPDVSAALPPTDRSDARPHWTVRDHAGRDLPLQPTPLIGRAAELSEIARIVGDPTCRLLTLLGPGGIGKTRLALEVAATQSGAFRDGVAFVALAAIGTPNQIMAAIGDALKLSFTEQSNLTAHLFNYLHTRHMLLILDNFEHLLGGVDLVYDILQRAPHVTLLVTSRTRLNLQAEWLFDVEGLTYPPSDSQLAVATPTLAKLTDYSAVQLFVQRATQVQAGFSLSEATLATIGRICQQVVGMPLAIELAAAGVRILPIDEIERQICSNVDLLATTLHDVPVRHRSLRAVFEHSWYLLSPAEHTHFSRLAIFRGGCTAAAAEQVAGASILALMALVGKSLVRQQRAYSTAEPRFVLLEPLREYALEQLTARGEAAAVHRAHALYYLALAEKADAQWDGPTADALIEQLDQEYDNLRAVLQWAREGAPTLGLKLGAALRRYWQRRGYYNEGRAWLEDLLALEKPGADPAAMSVRQYGLYAAAWLASDQNDHAHAMQLFEQGMAVRRALGETAGDTNLLVPAARAARAAGQYKRATELLEDAVARHRALDNRESMSAGGLELALYELALVLREQGNLVRANRLFHEYSELQRKFGDREGITIGLMGLGDIARDWGNVAQLRAYCEQSLTLARDLGLQWAIGFSLNNLAVADYLVGDLAQAFARTSEAVTLFRNLHSDGSVAELLITLGQILQARGEVDAAYNALTEALQIAAVVGPRLLVAAALEGLAGVSAPPAGAALVARLLCAAAALRVQMGTPVRPVDQLTVERVLATARLTLGEATFAVVWSEAERQPLEQMLRAIPSPVEFSTDSTGASSTQSALTGSPLSATLPAMKAPPMAATLTPPPRRRVDWGMAQDVPALYGRTDELTMLTQWVVTDRCRVIALVGIGGVGKTSLAVTFGREVASHFDHVVFRSLGEAPPFAELLDQLIQSVAGPQMVIPPRLADKRSLLIDLLRQTRALLILDNLETIRQRGSNEAPYLPGYEAYGLLFKALGETAHQSCLLLTSREQPSELAVLEGARSPVRTLRVTGLPEAAWRSLLIDHELIGTPGDMAALARRYDGNPLALKLVAEPIRDLFSRDIATFLSEGSLFFEGVSSLLAQQISRASALEQTLLTWLAVAREPTSLTQLLADLAGGANRNIVLAALQTLWRRNLIERGRVNLTFALQRVVLEYLTEQLVERIVDEIVQGQCQVLSQYALSQAAAKDYVRHSQERLIARPLLARLIVIYNDGAKVEQQLLSLLAAYRSQSSAAQGYGPANLVALLRLQRGDLRGIDLSQLALRGVYLQGVEMQNTTLAGATIQDSVFTETFDAITAVAISSTGEYWAAASRRGEVRLWKANGQILHRAWRPHTDMVWSLTFSPDGRTLASGSWDSTVKLWDVTSGALLWSAKHTNHVNSVVFAPNGTMLASSGNDATILWNLQSGAQLQTLPHPGPAPVLTWSPDGHLLASGDLEGCIRLWAIHKHEPVICVQTIVGHSNFVDGLAFAPDSNTLASAGRDGAVKLWDTSTLFSQIKAEEVNGDVAGVRLRATLVGHSDRVHRVVWSPDGRTLASSSRDQTIWLWDVEQGKYQLALRGHLAGVNGLAFTPDNRSLLSGGQDGALRVWDVAGGECLRVLQGYATTLYDIDWSPDGTQLVTAGSDALVTLYTVNGQTPPRVLRGHGEVVFRVGWSSNHRWLASTEGTDAIRLWDSTSETSLQVLQHPDKIDRYFYGVAWSPDGQRIASGTYQRGVLVWDVTAHTQQWIGRTFPIRTRHVAWSPDGMRLAGGGEDGIVYVWDATDGALLYKLIGHHSMVTCVTWSFDGTRLASASSSKEGGEIFVWDAQRGEQIHTFTGHSGIVYAVAWSIGRAQGVEWLISGGSDGALRWWDVQRGECMRVREAHQGTVQAIRRSPNGTKLASCGDDGTIMLWDLHSGELLQTIRRDRPYERMDITGIRGLTTAQRMALLTLGAVER
ncbi:MAG: AAA family ATPase [Chloroflexi bacterium]|nr:AAA family ATPase [Chloroflexota bacterium]